MADVVGAAAVADEMRECTYCGLDREETEMENASRCKLCNATRGRITRSGIDAASIEKLTALEPVARHTFYTDNMHCIKCELKKSIIAAISLTVVDEQTQGWVGTGEYLDEHEVRDKYPEKHQASRYDHQACEFHHMR